MSAHLRSILLAWLLIAPLVPYALRFPTSGDLFRAELEESTYGGAQRGGAYLKHASTISLRELLEPTRILFATALLLLVLPVLKKRPVTGLDRTELWMLLFSIIVMTSVFTKSWRFAYGIRVAIDAFIIPFIAYAVMRRLITTEERFRKLVRILGYIGLYVIIIALVDRITHDGLTYRVHGPFRSGQILQVVLAVAFFAVWSEQPGERGLPGLKRDVRNWIRPLVLFVTAPIVLLTWSRGNWAGYLSAVCVYLLMGRRLIHQRKKFGSIGFALVIAPLLAIASAILETSGATQRVVNISTIEARLTTWETLLQGTLNNPAFGIGLNNLRNVLAQNWRNLNVTHNCHLSLLIELGTLGLGAYLMVMLSLLRSGLRLARSHPEYSIRWRGLAVIAIIFSHQVPSLFADNLYITEPGHLLVFTFAGAVVGCFKHYSSTAQTFEASCKHRATVDPISPFIPVRAARSDIR